MKNNELLKKVEKVCYGIFTFFFWYLVVGFFLKSDYPIYEQPFNRANAYEVLRDGITLSAYILAPAIAVALFSDWRGQHAAIKNEKISLEVRDLLNLTYHNMITLPPVGDDEQYSKSIKRHFEYMMALDRLEKDLNSYDELSLDYAKKLKIINDFNYVCAINIQRLYFQSKDESYKADILKISLKNIDNAKKLKELSEELRPLVIHPD